MTDWTQGYISDIEYLPGFYVQQTPAHLDAVCLLQGIEPPVHAVEGYAYCELGCGVGETAMTIAAANMHADVYGLDFNPAHIARGRALARSAGLDNITFLETSFEELDRSGSPDLPMFDYITLHGVWSWVSQANRQHIVSFINRRLKPGGVVLVTYNALPAWTQSMPLQKLLLLAASAKNGRSDGRISEALALAKRISEAGGSIPAKVIETIGTQSDGNLAYLSHEYLNEHWAPCYQIDVAKALGSAKLVYAGSANLLENFPDLCHKPAQRDLIAEFPADMRQTADDYFLERSFRRDVFVRGARAIPDRRLDSRIALERLSLVIPSEATNLALKVPAGEAKLGERFYRPALDALASTNHSISELLALEAAGSSTATAREVLGMMIGSRQCARAVRQAGHEDRMRVRRFNAALLAVAAEQGRSVIGLASAELGSAITVPLFEMLAYEALVAGAAEDASSLGDAIWTILTRRGDKILHDGRQIDDENVSRAHIRTEAEKIITLALPIWRRVGAF